MATKEARIIRTRDIESGTVTFQDKRRPTDSPVVADATVFFPEYAKLSIVAKHLVLHGLNGKVGDSAADPEGKRTAVQVMTATLDALKAGTWSSGGGSPLDDHTKVMREFLSADLESALDMKRADIDKLVRSSLRKAFDTFAEAAGIPKEDRDGEWKAYRDAAAADVKTREEAAKARAKRMSRFVKK